jgi:hypothetical protein
MYVGKITNRLATKLRRFHLAATCRCEYSSASGEFFVPREYVTRLFPRESVATALCSTWSCN